MTVATDIERAAMATAIAKRQPGIGRTAMMKYMYMLQTVRHVPLGYRFQLYAYGPYDSSVLTTIGIAENWGAVKETAVQYPSGYGYEIEPSKEAEAMIAYAEKFVGEHEGDIGWVVENFGGYSAAGLELLSTMIFADREAFDIGDRVSEADLVRTVLEIKPRFSVEQAQAIARKLTELKILKALD